MPINGPVAAFYGNTSSSAELGWDRLLDVDCVKGYRGVEENEEDTAEDRTQLRTLKLAQYCGGSRSQIEPAEAGLDSMLDLAGQHGASQFVHSHNPSFVLFQRKSRGSKELRLSRRPRSSALLAGWFRTSTPFGSVENNRIPTRTRLGSVGQQHQVLMT